MTKKNDFKPDEHDRLVIEGVFESAVFSAFNNLVCARKEEGQLSKTIVSERMGVNKSVVTKLTATSTNMKLHTVASMANALDADVLILLVDRRESRVFSAIGDHAGQVIVGNISILTRLPDRA